jgi:hypothetical protein
MLLRTSIFSGYFWGPPLPWPKEKFHKPGLEEDSSDENTSSTFPEQLELEVKQKATSVKDNNDERLKATPKEILYLYKDGSFEIYRPR